MSWNIKTPGDYINGPLTVAGASLFNSNVGIGIAPSAGGSDYYRTFEIGKAGCGLFAATNSLTSSELVFLSGNGVLAYNAGPEWKYGNNGAAAIYGIEDGIHKWYNAISGTAGGVFVPSLAMTLDGNGNLIVGGAFSQAPSATTIYNDGTINSILSSGAGGTTLISAISGVSNGFQISVTAANEQTYTWFNGGTPSMKLDSLGNLLVGPTSANANGGCLQLRSGITFPATQVASTDGNTLDDYEEGTFTPTVVGTATYTVQVGRYVKIGNRVFVQIRLIIATIGTGENWRISGLPFASANNAIAPISIGYFANLAIVANFLSGYVNTGYAHIVLAATTTASANITNGAPVLGNSSDLSISFHYEV